MLLTSCEVYSEKESEAGSENKSASAGEKESEAAGEKESEAGNEKKGAVAGEKVPAEDSENRYIAAGSKTKVQSYTEGFPVGKGSSPRTGDPLPVIVVLILLSSLTMLAIIACKERLRKERKVRQ